MSKVINFPKPVPTETIDQAYFEKFNDAALLLKCFESVKDATEFVEEGGKIEERDDVYVGLIEAYWALKVLFERRTGADAKKVSDDHWEVASKYLLAGKEAPPLMIPTRKSLIAPLPPEFFAEHSDLALACTAFNSSDQIRLGTNATTVLRLLVLRLSGGSMETMAAHIGRKPGETLQ